MKIYPRFPLCSFSCSMYDLEAAALAASALHFGMII